MPDLAQALHFAAEAVKIVGGLASFYAVIKLRQIEKRYLFKATVPKLIVQLDEALGRLGSSLSKPGDHRGEILETLNHLSVDVKNVKRKCRGDSSTLCKEMLSLIERSQMTVEKTLLIDIYGKGRGLIRSLKNDINDQGWSGK